MIKLSEIDTQELIKELTNRYDNCVIGLKKDNPSIEDETDDTSVLFVHRGSHLKCLGLAECIKFCIWEANKGSNEDKL